MVPSGRATIRPQFIRSVQQHTAGQKRHILLNCCIPHMLAFLWLLFSHWVVYHIGLPEFGWFVFPTYVQEAPYFILNAQQLSDIFSLALILNIVVYGVALISECVDCCPPVVVIWCYICLSGCLVLTTLVTAEALDRQSRY
jgi:hypothetical protein